MPRKPLWGCWSKSELFAETVRTKCFRNLSCRRLQLDEMWARIYCKEKNRTEEIAKAHPDSGDVRLWVAVDADTKLVPAWFLGQRDFRTAKVFVD